MYYTATVFLLNNNVFARTGVHSQVPANSDRRSLYGRSCQPISHSFSHLSSNMLISLNSECVALLDVCMCVQLLVIIAPNWIC